MKMAKMHLRVIPIFIAIMIFLNCDGVATLSKNEDKELERQLKLLNKPAVKTIKTEYGDIYDCVDFYKQPAFDHPLLKNKPYHPRMKPSFLVTKRDKEPSTVLKSSSEVRLKDGGCPFGTVPIKRTTKEDLIREKNRFNASYNGGESHFALGQTQIKPDSQIMGIGGTMSLWNPKVQTNQWSASVMKVQNGLEVIQGGWIVDPDYYRDTRTRFYILFQTDKTTCYNTRCSGFVMINETFPLDHIFSVSHPLLVQEEGFSIKKDLEDNKWWLIYGRSELHIGFWPPELFSGLQKFATQASWGGQGFSLTSSFPPMGAGNFPNKDSDRDGYFTDIYFFDSTGGRVEHGGLEVLQDAQELYRVQEEDGGFGHTVYYGGPGVSQ